jgi:catechol 2,3-dioxygenase
MTGLRDDPTIPLTEESLQPAQPAIHSLVEVALQVPDLARGEAFYGAFGLALTPHGDRLELRGRSGHPRSAPVSERAAATLYEGPHKRLKHLTFGAFEEDLPGLVRRLEVAGIRQIDPPRGVESAPGALWIHDPEGLPLQIIPGDKSTPSAFQESRHPEPDGWRHAPTRTDAKALPHRLGHCFLFTADLDRATAFYCDVLGLGVSDKNEHVSFLHAKHGSDHHVIGFAQSDAPGFHHFSWEVGNIDQIGIGGQAMAARGYGGWGFGRHVGGSNWFWYVRDPFGGWSEYFCDIDYLPAGTEVPRRELAPEDSVFLWGPPMPEDFITNNEALHG